MGNVGVVIFIWPGLTGQELRIFGQKKRMRSGKCDAVTTSSVTIFLGNR